MKKWTNCQTTEINVTNILTLQKIWDNFAQKSKISRTEILNVYHPCHPLFFGNLPVSGVKISNSDPQYVSISIKINYSPVKSESTFWTVRESNERGTSIGLCHFDAYMICNMTHPLVTTLWQSVTRCRSCHFRSISPLRGPKTMETKKYRWQLQIR